MKKKTFNKKISLEEYWDWEESKLSLGDNGKRNPVSVHSVLALSRLWLKKEQS